MRRHSLSAVYIFLIGTMWVIFYHLRLLATYAGHHKLIQANAPLILIQAS